MSEARENASKVVVVVSDSDEFRALMGQCVDETVYREYIYSIADDLIERAKAADLVIIEKGPDILGAVELFNRIRDAVADKAVMLVLEDLDTDTALELMRIGLVDVVSMPADPSLISRKLVRVIEEMEGTLFPFPGHTTLKYGASRLEEIKLENRRQAYRVVPTDDQVCLALFSVFGKETRCKVHDLSLASDRRRGGLALRLSPEEFKALRAHRWRDQETVRFKVILGSDARQISVRGKVRRFQEHPDGSATIGLEYTPLEAKDENLFVRYWTAVQRSRRYLSGKSN